MTTMEDLTKTQIVLLTLLVSFITSIATGIITTSLLAEAPQSITQTIDRVVERTVERVTPAPAGGTTVREVTIVQEGDAVISAIESSAKSIVRIKREANRDGTQEFYAIGVVADKAGRILTDKRNVDANGSYTIVFSDGAAFPATVSKISESGNLALFQLVADDAKLKSLSAITFSAEDPKLGQTVVAVQGSESTSIAVGRILSLNAPAGSAMTNIAPLAETPGGPLLNLSGELVGLKTSNTDMTLPPSSYTMVSSLTKFITDNS